ncbi:MAG: glycosyltransferase family 4 protein [Planctomycetia bacterium]
MSRTLLVICQVYDPDPAAVGQQVTDVAREMASRGWRVVVYTSARGYEDPSIRYPRHEERDGVIIRRLPLSSFGKQSLGVRLLAHTLFMAQAVFFGLCTRGLAAVLVSTSPPFAGFGGALVSAVRRVPFTWWVMDVNPDQITVTGRLCDRSIFVRLFQWMNRFTLARAAAVITLDRFMAERVHGQAEDPITVEVVPPWAKTNVGRVPPEDAIGFRRAHGLENAFVVMYSGNHAIQHPLTTLLDAARRLEHDPRFMFVFIGGGAGKAEVEGRIAAGARNLRSLPFQPLDTLRSSLGAADVHAVSMGDEVVGIVHPCKIYGAMAVGRPILFLGPERSHGGEIVRGHAVGWNIPHGDVDGAVHALLTAAAMPAEEITMMGGRAVQVIDSDFQPRRLRGRVGDIVEGALAAIPANASPTSQRSH